MFYRRAKRRNPNGRVSRSSLHWPLGDEDIDLVPPKTPALRYPDPEDQDYGANLSSDGKESSHSSFEPKFTPAIISISSKIK